MLKFIQPLSFLLFFAIGVFGYLLPEVGYFSSVPGDLGDARMNSVILEHAYRWILGRDTKLWSPTFFYPFEGVLAFSENHLGSIPTYALFRSLGLSRETAYDAWFFVGACVNFFAAQYALRRMEFSGFAAAAGAFVFAFSLPTLINQDGHSQLLHRYAVPLAMLGIYRTLNCKRAFHLWQTLFWLTVQFYCSIYMGAFLVFLIGATLLATIFIHEGRRRLACAIASIQREPLITVTGISAVALLSALMLGWLLLHYQMIGHEYKLARSANEIASMLPRPQSYLISTSSSLSSWVGGWISDIPMYYEHQLFPGIGVLLVATIGIFAVLTCRFGQYGQGNYLLGQVALISFVMLYALTLYFHGYSLYLLLLKIPGLTALRAVSRIIFVMLMPISILVAIAIEKLQVTAAHRGAKTLLALAVGMPLLLGAETAGYIVVNERIDTWRNRIRTVRQLLPTHLVNQPILYISQLREENGYYADRTELDAMILAQDLGIPTMNGYSGNFPPGYLAADPCISFESRLRAYADFRKLPKNSVDDLARRVVHLARQPCEGEIATPSDDVIGEEQARLIRLKIKEVLPPGNRFSIVIENNSPLPFNTLHFEGPIRLSWRFVPVGPTGSVLSEPGWDNRKEIFFTLKPGASILQWVDTGPLPPAGQYHLEVSLVMEHVTWLHDIGMPICTIPISLPVGKD